MAAEYKDSLEPHAVLEQNLINDFLASHGMNPATFDRCDPANQQLLKKATTYAGERLAQVQCRATLVRTLQIQI